jgi:hypothetical protein
LFRINTKKINNNKLTQRNLIDYFNPKPSFSSILSQDIAAVSLDIAVKALAIVALSHSKGVLPNCFKALAQYKAALLRDKITFTISFMPFT